MILMKYLNHSVSYMIVMKWWFPSPWGYPKNAGCFITETPKLKWMVPGVAPHKNHPIQPLASAINFRSSLEVNSSKVFALPRADDTETNGFMLKAGHSFPWQI